MGRWLLGLLLTGAALGIAENRIGFMRKGMKKAKERMPKERIPQVFHFTKTRQPWWKVG